MAARRVSLLTTGARIVYFIGIAFALLVLVLGGALVVACFVNPKAMGGSQAVAIGVGLSIAVAIGITLLFRSLRSVATVEVEADGAWILRGPGGWRVGKVAPGTERELVSRTSKTLLMVDPYQAQRVTTTRAQLRAGDRTRRMLPAAPERYASLLTALGASPPEPLRPGAGEQLHTFSAGRG